MTITAAQGRLTGLLFVVVCGFLEVDNLEEASAIELLCFDDWNCVCTYPRITSYQREFFTLCLSDEHSVKRVFMMWGIKE